ncbi:Os03g0128000 [Oryza sativa Japonica Group]|uniref:Os03g0128000 protein n=2 Tax=Oryza sativa subsp. japonica TaxID=39947 RepID=Q0DVI8_ORYSJ|nr:hypothetical protein EE612_015063 [Oryza sativa]BAF10750.2 Os03g0128000 [Oryza sativa Japonica Group]BAS82097.1 Os03g0128000 [Oryza sativa Japonica Group]|eukprot:NP_001048836.2 Os03g0128000 [Oryza sativa Japonica Group]
MAAAAQRLVAAVVVLVACLALPAARGLNITAMLNGYPDYKMFNKYLSETKVCDEINARESITLLVLGDGPMSTLVLDADQSLAGIKNALRLHAILDYFDPKKIRGLPDAGRRAVEAGGSQGNEGVVRRRVAVSSARRISRGRVFLRAALSTSFFFPFFHVQCR